jgi:SAM-dependent methyltransferase
MKREADTSMPDVPLSHLPADEKAKRSGTFGAVASNYEKYRPGPPADAVDWILDGSHGRFVDLGAGTGALTRVLVPRAQEVIAVEPDDRMRAVLAEEVPGAVALKGRGESIPVADGWADAVLASSSWHWMDLLPTLAEVARVLVPGGVLGALWSGPDPDGSFLAQARALIEQQSAGRASGGEPATSGSETGDGELASLIMTDADRPNSTLEIPQGVPFDQPRHEVFVWDVALTADDLIGLLSTFSWIIMMSEEVRQGVFAEARRLLREFLGVEGDVTVDVAFRCEAWRTHRHS